MRRNLSLRWEKKIKHLYIKEIIKIILFTTFLAINFIYPNYAFSENKEYYYNSLYLYFNGMENIEKQIFEMVNQERSKRGLNILQYDDKLSQAARQHSMEMGELNYFSHTSPINENKDVAKRVRNCGLIDIAVGENIGNNFGYSEDILAQQFMTGWMNSTGHRENILRENFTHIGVGVIKTKDGYYYGTQVFASREIEFYQIKASEKNLDEYHLFITLYTDFENEIGIWINSEYYDEQKANYSGVFNLKIPFAKNSGIKNISIGVRKSGDYGSFLLLAEIKFNTDVEISRSIELKRESQKLRIKNFFAEEKQVKKYELNFVGKILKSNYEMVIFIGGGEKDKRSERVNIDNKGYFNTKTLLNKSSDIQKISFGIREKNSSGLYNIPNSISLNTDEIIENIFLRE